MEGGRSTTASVCGKVARTGRAVAASAAGAAGRPQQGGGLVHAQGHEGADLLSAPENGQNLGIENRQQGHEKKNHVDDRSADSL